MHLTRMYTLRHAYHPTYRDPDQDFAPTNSCVQRVRSYMYIRGIGPRHIRRAHTHTHTHARTQVREYTYTHTHTDTHIYRVRAHGIHRHTNTGTHTHTHRDYIHTRATCTLHTSSSLNSAKGSS